MKKVIALILLLTLFFTTSMFQIATASDEGNLNVVSVNNNHAAIKDGDLYTWGGSNTYGQLGNGTTANINEPQKIMDSVKSVDIGYWHSAAIRDDDTLWMWGENLDGNLGNGATTSSYVPVKVMDNVKKVSLGEHHSAAIKNDGTLWTWGNNTDGQLGNGTTTNSCTPIKVMDNVKEVILNDFFSAAIKNDGTLWTWGNNTTGQLGNGTTTGSSVPVKIMDNVKMVCWDSRSGTALKNDGTLWTWGNNTTGQLGNGTTTSSYTPIKVMDNVESVDRGISTVVVKKDGSLWIWGMLLTTTYKNGGDIDLIYSAEYTTPVKLTENVQKAEVFGSSECIVQKKDGTVWLWKATPSENALKMTSQKIMNDADIVAVSGRYIFKRDGSLWEWDYANNNLNELHFKNSPYRIELSSNRSSMSVIGGETFNVLATIYDNNNNSVSPTGITFSVENKSVAEVIDGNFSGNNAIAVIKANSVGTTTLKVSDANKNVVVTAPITVLRSRNNTYTIYSVPHGTTNYSWALVNDTYNFYNFSGLYVDNFIKTVRADGSCSIAFDAYNENYTYGIVEVYDSNGEIKDAVVIDKYKPDNTSIKEALWDNGGSIVQLVNPFDNQTWQSYKNSAFSEETRVTLDSVPEGGYIKITPSSRESLLLCILNEIDIVLSTQDAIDKIAGFGESTNVKLFQNIANSMVKQDTIYKPIKEHMKDFAVGSSKNFLKGIGKDFVINANSIGTFVETLKNNLSTIDWQNMVENACVDTAVSITEKVFKGVAGMAGAGLNACFAIGSTGNLICECNDFINLIDTTSIYIQNPGDSRTFKGVSVETVIPINNNVSLETYRIESTEIESYFEKNTFSNRNFTEEFLIKQGLYKKPIVEYINISMINNGKETQLNCKATVSIPVPESMKNPQWNDTPWDNNPSEEKSLKVNVYRVETDGTLTKMNNANIVLRNDNYYVQFETDHFSIYAIVAENDSDTGGHGSKSDIDDMFGGVSDWAKAEIKEAVEKKLIPNALTFTDLRENINRKEFAALAVELYESITGKYAEYSDVPFKDISQYDTEIKKAYSLDITTGTSETTFEPNTLISREQLATMLCRVFKKYAWDRWSIENDNKYSLNYNGVSKFADDDEISGYARPSVYFMAKHNIINGVGNNKFAPKTDKADGFASREQAIVMALRCYNHLFSDEVINDSQIDTSSVDYETLYLDYIKNNTDYFSRGIMLCDLNDDDIPELFSIAYDTKGDLVYYHEFKDNKVITPSGDSVKTYIDIDNLVRPTTFFEDVGHFIGIYRNRTTGQKVLINSIADGSENDRFDIITYNGENLVLKDEGVKSAINNSWPINEKRDTVMSDYELANSELYTSFLLRDEFGGEYDSDPVESLKGLIEDFKKSETSTKYDKTTDGEFFCYIRNINLSDNEIELIPAASINYEEYNNAINSDKMFTLNGETMSIQLDDFLYSEYGIAHLYQMPSFEYQFYVPTEDYPTSVIEGYIGNTPIKVKMSSDLKIRYGVSGEYDIDGTPMGYETLGRNQEYSISEYITHFAEYNMGSYYKAVIKNNELEFLDVMYDE